MAHVNPDRVLETSTTTGSGNLTLAGAITGFLSFAGASVANSDTFHYAVEGVDSGGVATGEWETGTGTYVSATPAIARTTVRASSNANAAVVFSAGTKRVSITSIAFGVTHKDATGVVQAPAGISGTTAAFSGAISGSNFSGSSSGTNTGDQSFAGYALLASPTFTGTPSGPTAAANTNTTQLATTAYVQTEIAGYATIASPTFTGTPAAPTAATATNTTQIATTAYVKAQAYATLAAPTFTGIPAATTAAYGTNTTQLATTAFVDNLLDLNGVTKTAAYTLALTDRGGLITITTGGITVPANGSVAFPIGAVVTVYNNSAATQTIAITTDTMYLNGTATTGTRTLAIRGLVTLTKVLATTWVASGAVT